MTHVIKEVQMYGVYLVCQDHNCCWHIVSPLARNFPIPSHLVPKLNPHFTPTPMVTLTPQRIIFFPQSPHPLHNTNK